MKKQKITGKITSKEYQQKSNNYKLKIVIAEQHKLFFYSQQKHQAETEKLEIGKEYTFFLYNNLKYWFLERWEVAPELGQTLLNSFESHKDEILNSNLHSLEKQVRIKAVERLENRLKSLRNQIKEANDNQELVFLNYFEQFTNLLLIKQLKARNKPEKELTETEKKERQILDNITVNWFYKVPHETKET
jgi:hypothetical protein